MSRSLLLLLLLHSMFAGCATPMSTFQTGRTTPPLKFQAVTGVGVNVSSSFIGAVIDNAETAADKARQAIDTGKTPELSEGEQRDLMRGAFAYSLMGPTPLYEIGLRFGILDRWDVGVAFTTAGFRFETKVQLLRENTSRQKDPGRVPVDLAIGLQVIHQSFDIPIPDTFKDIFQIDDFSRTDLTLPVVVSRNFGKFGFVYGGPKFVYSFLSADVLEKLSTVAGRTVAATRDMWSVGGVVGGGVGYKYVFLMAELNVLYYSYKPTLLDTDVDLSGVNIYPAVGLKINFHSPV